MRAKDNKTGREILGAGLPYAIRLWLRRSAGLIGLLRRNPSGHTCTFSNSTEQVALF
jgi:hypothetical protein